MIKTVEQAVRIQKSRYASNKMGIAKAVRRYYLSEFPGSAYRAMISTLPANWPEGKEGTK